jgi:hypothetical protein
VRARLEVSLATQQPEKLIRAHAGSGPAPHAAYKALPAGRAGLGADDADATVIFDDINFVALVQAD